MTAPPSICDILPAAASVLGVAGAQDRLGLAERVGDVQRLAVVLVDGLGHHVLPLLAPDAPLLASVLSGGLGRLDELACTLPSTTPTSLVSLGTGVRPGAHGILGFRVNVPGTDRVLTHVSWRDNPDPALWQPVPTWFERLAAAGLDTRVLLPKAFGGSGLTIAAYRGARFCGLTRADDPAERLLHELGDGADLAYGYASALDTAAHASGVGSAEWHEAARDVDAYLTRLVEGLPAGTALVVTADHGGLNATERIDLDADPALADGIAVVAGEPRFRHLHTVPGAAEDVAASWRAVLGDRADVLTRDEAVAADLFGPVDPRHLARIGDVVVMCSGSTIVLATAHESPEAGELVGFHGGRTAVETAIPLITIRR